MTIAQPVYGEKTMQQIPVIDLSAARSGGLASRQAVAREIDATCREIGFFTITGHGVPIATMDQLRSKAGIISYRIYGRSSRRALRMRRKLTMRKWRNWPR